LSYRGTELKLFEMYRPGCLNAQAER
jgi:hypothetical protein